MLCNLKFKDREDVPANAIKKRNILATMLRNLNAPFSGTSAIIAGRTWNTRRWTSPATRRNTGMKRAGSGTGDSPSATCPWGGRSWPG